MNRKSFLSSISGVAAACALQCFGVSEVKGREHAHYFVLLKLPLPSDHKEVTTGDGWALINMGNRVGEDALNFIRESGESVLGLTEFGSRFNIPKYQMIDGVVSLTEEFLKAPYALHLLTKMPKAGDVGYKGKAMWRNS